MTKEQKNYTSTKKKQKNKTKKLVKQKKKKRILANLPHNEIMVSALVL